MLISEILHPMREDNDDHLHARQLAKTGFWGDQGAGCIFMARDTGRFLIAHRSRHVEQPGTWGTWGGAIDRGENPEDAARREAMEEAGHDGDIDILPLYVFRNVVDGNENFRYSNFLAIVDHEFDPVLNWETEGYEWCEFGQWPRPLHFGLKAVLNDPASVATMRQAASQAKAAADSGLVVIG